MESLRASAIAADDRFVMSDSIDQQSADTKDQAAHTTFASLTSRQWDVLRLVVGGRRNKEIAHLLGISQRTVETHRAEVMKRTNSTSLPQLLRLVFMAEHAGYDLAGTAAH